MAEDETLANPNWACVRYRRKGQTNEVETLICHSKTEADKALKEGWHDTPAAIKPKGRPKKAEGQETGGTAKVSE